MRSRIAIIIAWIAALVAIGLLLYAYTSAVSERLYDEAKRNFSEVYQQVDSNFLTFMDDTWKNLGDWGPYIRDLDEDAAASYIENRRGVWGFSRFLFLNENGEALTSQGESTTFDLGEDDFLLFQEKESIMAEQGLDGTAPETIFATPIEAGTYQGFPYQAVAVTYTNEALANTIRTDAFSGQSMGFVIYPDGTIAFSTQEGGNVFSNYLTYLAAGSNLSEQQLTDLRIDWESGARGVQICSLSDEDYYIAYQPLGYEDYTLLGVVPSSAVSGSMRNVQEMTIDVLVKIFIIIAIVGGIQIFLYMRRRNRKSKAEIEYRDVLFDLLSENLDDIFAVIDAETLKISYITPNVNRLLGVSAAVAKEDIEKLRQGIANKERAVDFDLLRALQYGERQEVLQEWINQEDGTHRWFREAIYHMNIQGEEKYIFILSDRTEDRIMAQSLEEALAGAKSANKAKSQFLSSMSHDIRTPMNAIMGLNELLEANADDPVRVRDYVRKISSASTHLLNLINDVLDMSKIESGKTELSLEELNFAELIEDITTIMAPQAEAKNQTFEVRIGGNPPEYIMGDKLRLNQIFINLLSNAVKYTPKDGQIDFIVVPQPSSNPNYTTLHFIVHDNGMGMSEDYLKVIFDPFTRETSAANSAIQGTGLGMAITKNLVDLMGGTISVESELGVGSTFTVDLSFAIPEERKGALDGLTSSQEDEAEYVDEHVLDGLHILLAEDNELSAEMLMERLDMEGATVERASNGQEAIELFEASDPGTFDLILMDVQMPLMGGYEATQGIRAGEHPEAQTIPIFAMTANVFAEDVRDALEAGMDAHIPKPVEMNVLRKAADRALNGRENPRDEDKHETDR